MAERDADAEMHFLELAVGLTDAAGWAGATVRATLDQFHRRVGGASPFVLAWPDGPTGVLLGWTDDTPPDREFITRL